MAKTDEQKRADYKYRKANRERINERYRTYYKNLDSYTKAIRIMSKGIIARTRQGGRYHSKGIENRLGSYTQIMHYLNENFKDDIEQLLAEGKTPSVDRLGQHYEVGGIRVIDKDLNSKLGAMKKTIEFQVKVADIKLMTMMKPSLTQADLARIFDCSQSCISNRKKAIDIKRANLN